jgi:hypothetical protein
MIELVINDILRGELVKVITVDSYTTTSYLKERLDDSELELVRLPSHIGAEGSLEDFYKLVAYYIRPDLEEYINKSWEYSSGSSNIRTFKRFLKKALEYNYVIFVVNSEDWKGNILSSFMKFIVEYQKDKEKLDWTRRITWVFVSEDDITEGYGTFSYIGSNYYL